MNLLSHTLVRVVCPDCNTFNMCEYEIDKEVTPSQRQDFLKKHPIACRHCGLEVKLVPVPVRDKNAKETVHAR